MLAVESHRASLLQLLPAKTTSSLRHTKGTDDIYYTGAREFQMGKDSEQSNEFIGKITVT